MMKFSLIKFVKIQDILNTNVESDIGYFIETDLRHPDNKKERTKNFPFAPEYKVIPKDKNDNHLKKIKPKNYTNAQKLLRD